MLFDFPLSFHLLFFIALILSLITLLCNKTYHNPFWKRILPLSVPACTALTQSSIHSHLSQVICLYHNRPLFYDWMRKYLRDTAVQYIAYRLLSYQRPWERFGVPLKLLTYDKSFHCPEISR